MKRFDVTCTMIYNGHVEIEAESKDQALKKASEMLDSRINNDFPGEGTFGKVDFIFGEATADYADEIYN